MNKLWFGYDLSEAVDKPRLHTQLVPDQSVTYEDEADGDYRIQDYVIEGLKELGHNVTGKDLFTVVQAIYRELGGKRRSEV